MAKFEQRFTGEFDSLITTIEQEILKGSMSATLEDKSDYEANGVRCAVRVFERYSAIGGNRVSMNVTLVGSDNQLFLSGITSGGSQAMFFKINTVGEESFLDCLKNVVEGL